MAKKVCLVIIDGFGLAERQSGGDATEDAIFINELKTKYGCCPLYAHGEYVGLPAGVPGNSEVGHMTIGSGRAVEHYLVRIKKWYQDGSLERRIGSVASGFSQRIHIIGLLSDGGVHSHIDHARYLQELLPKESSVYIHAIADGIDVKQCSFPDYYKSIDGVVSVSGRFFSMDRDNNDERIEAVFRMMTEGKPEQLDIQKLYREGIVDERIRPTLLKDERILRDDTIIFFNFRADRMRQLVKRFDGHGRIFTMTDYGVGIGTALMDKERVLNTLPEWLAAHGIRQLHIAETEKYAHVTYFLNGGNEEQCSREDRILIPTPRVEFFVETPGLSMDRVADECIRGIEKRDGFIVVNMAGPDMLGHTGSLEQTKESVRILDQLIKKIYDQCMLHEYTLLITSDHGNSENMKDEAGTASKSHTTNKVPFIIAGNEPTRMNLPDRSLSDIAPTVCTLFGILKPSEMTGISLVNSTDQPAKEEE